MRVNVKRLEIFLPQLTSQQVYQLGLFDNLADSIEQQALQQDWQSLFCKAVGYSSDYFPLTAMRLAQLNVDSRVKMACCCDPVMMQMTHRGAYMMGQAQLQLSMQDETKIVEQINQQLMREGECLHIIDKHCWLLTSEQVKPLVSPRIEELIGKDMFNFAYQGKEANYWQQLATEIQMLIKQMIDYQGITPAPAEMINNIHFFDSFLLDQDCQLPSIQNPSVAVLTNDKQLKIFCQKTGIKHKGYPAALPVNEDYCAIVAFEGDRKRYPELIEYGIEQFLSAQLTDINIVCQESILTLTKKPGFWPSLFGKFRNLLS